MSSSLSSALFSCVAPAAPAALGGCLGGGACVALGALCGCPAGGTSVAPGALCGCPGGGTCVVPGALCGCPGGGGGTSQCSTRGGVNARCGVDGRAPRFDVSGCAAGRFSRRRASRSAGVLRLPRRACSSRARRACSSRARRACSSCLASARRALRRVTTCHSASSAARVVVSRAVVSRTASAYVVTYLSARSAVSVEARAAMSLPNGKYFFFESLVRPLYR